MKKLILFLAMLCSSAAMAQATPVQVTQECIRQMSLDICMAIPDRAKLAPGDTMLFSKVGRLSSFAYQDYMDLYNPQVPTDPKMCDVALHYMQEQPGGDHDKIARALWTPKKGSENNTDPVSLASAAIAAIMLLGAAAHVSRMIKSKPQEKVGA